MADTTATSLIKSGLAAALAAAMALSAWSLYWFAHHVGLPPGVAWLPPIAFDGAALAASGYALRYAEEKRSGWLPRITVLAIAGLSSYINAQHAYLLGMPRQAMVFYAAPPLIVVTLFEIHMQLLRPKRTRKTRKKTRPETTRTRKAEVGGQEVRSDPIALREWAIGKGYRLGRRGPVPKELRAAYEAESNGHG